MSNDLGAAIEAVTRHFDSQAGSYLLTKNWIDTDDIRTAIEIAAPLIEADVRRKIAEEIEAQVGIWHAHHDDGLTRAAAIARGDSGKATGGVITSTPYVIGESGVDIERGDSGGQA